MCFVINTEDKKYDRHLVRGRAILFVVHLRTRRVCWSEPLKYVIIIIERSEMPISKTFIKHVAVVMAAPYSIRIILYYYARYKNNIESRVCVIVRREAATRTAVVVTHTYNRPQKIVRS